MPDLPITYRGVVYPWHCDHVGHMNVMWYVGKFDEATWHFFAMFGLTPSFLREQGRGMAAVQQNITYKRELRPGYRIDTLRRPGDQGEGDPLLPRDVQRRNGGDRSDRGADRGTPGYRAEEIVSVSRTGVRARQRVDLTGRGCGAGAYGPRVKLLGRADAPGIGRKGQLRKGCRVRLGAGPPLPGTVFSYSNLGVTLLGDAIGGNAGDHQIMKPETLAEMLRPQNTDVPLDLDFRVGRGRYRYAEEIRFSIDLTVGRSAGPAPT